MTAHWTPTYEPVWHERGPGRWTLSVREGADFSVYQDGRDYLIVLPGPHGIKREWNIDRINRWAVNYVEDVLDQPEEVAADEDAEFRAYRAHKQYERSLRTS